jgi:hypothetical protein
MREPFPDQVRKELLKLVKGLDQGVKPTDTRTVHRIHDFKHQSPLWFLQESPLSAC